MSASWRPPLSSAWCRTDSSAAPWRDDGDLLPFQIGERLERAAVHEVLAHHQRLVVVAVDAHALVGHDAKLDAAIDRIVETCRGGAAPGVERAGAERHDHLGPGIEVGEIGLEAFGFEIAALLGDVERHIGAQIDDADLDRLELLRRRGDGHQTRDREYGETPCEDHHVLSFNRLTLPRRGNSSIASPQTREDTARISHRRSRSISAADNPADRSSASGSMSAGGNE